MNSQEYELKGSLDKTDRKTSQSTEYNPLVRRTLETEYILENLEEVVNDEKYFSEGSLSTVVEQALVYKEDGELKKKEEIISSSKYSDYLDEKADKLIEKEVNGEEKVKNMIRSTKEVITNFEEKIGSSMIGKQYNVHNKELKDWIISETEYYN